MSELRKKEKEKITVRRCPTCGRIFKPPEERKFCPHDGAFLETQRIRTQELEQQSR
jgi:uncharacterized OB-fold protein